MTEQGPKAPTEPATEKLPVTSPTSADTREARHTHTHTPPENEAEHTEDEKPKSFWGKAGKWTKEQWNKHPKKVVAWIGMIAVSTAVLAETARHFDPTYHGDEGIGACTGVDTKALAATTGSTYVPVTESGQDLGNLGDQPYPNGDPSSWNNAVNRGKGPEKDQSPYGVLAASAVRITMPDGAITTGVVLETGNGHLAVVTAGDYRGTLPEEVTLDTWDRPTNQQITATGGCTFVDPNDSTKAVTILTVRRVNYFSDGEAQLADATSHTTKMTHLNGDLSATGMPLLTISYPEGRSRSGVPETAAVFPAFTQDADGGHSVVLSGVVRMTQNGPEVRPLDQNNQGAPVYMINEGDEANGLVGVISSVDRTPLTPEQLTQFGFHVTPEDAEQGNIYMASVTGTAELEAALNSESVRDAYDEEPVIDRFVDVINSIARNPGTCTIGAVALLIGSFFGHRHLLLKQRQQGQQSSSAP